MRRLGVHPRRNLDITLYSKIYKPQSRLFQYDSNISYLRSFVSSTFVGRRTIEARSINFDNRLIDSYACFKVYFYIFTTSTIRSATRKSSTRKLIGYSLFIFRKSPLSNPIKTFWLMGISCIIPLTIATAALSIK